MNSTCIVFLTMSIVSQTVTELDVLVVDGTKVKKTVSLYDKNGKLVARDETDDSGIAKLKLNVNRGRFRLSVLVIYPPTKPGNDPIEYQHTERIDLPVKENPHRVDLKAQASLTRPIEQLERFIYYVRRIVVDPYTGCVYCCCERRYGWRRVPSQPPIEESSSSLSSTPKRHRRQMSYDSRIPDEAYSRVVFERLAAESSMQSRNTTRHVNRIRFHRARAAISDEAIAVIKAR